MNEIKENNIEVYEDSHNCTIGIIFMYLLGFVIGSAVTYLTMTI